MKSQNNLTIITDAWSATNGVVTTLQNCVREAEKEGWNVTVIHPEMFPNIGAPGNKDVRLCLPIGLSKLIKDDSHIHIATEGVLGMAAMMLCKNRKWHYTTAYHTKWPDFLKHIYGINPKITTKCLKWFHKNSLSVLTTTETMVQELKDSGITDKAVAWTRGVNVQDFAHPRYVNNFGKKTKLVSVGRISKEKNLDVFCSLDPEKYDLTVVGDGAYLPELKEKYTHINYVGMKKGQELADEYRKADVMVFTSQADTFGLVMIESMYMGTPVAAFPVTGPNDVIDVGVTGFTDSDLDVAINKCLWLNRRQVSTYARKKWTWSNAWHIMRDNLV